MTSNTLDDLLADGVRGRHVLVRSDLNVPLNGSTVTDDGRVRASLPVLAKLSEAGARVLVMAHLGRPKGAPDSKYSIRPAADRLAELADFDVEVAQDVVGSSARELAAGLQDGTVLILENVRFDPRETSKNDDERASFARELADLTGPQGAYVDDAFGAVHRKHASVVDIAQLLPAYQGDLVRTEMEVLRRLTEAPQRPYVVVLGGSKVSDKLGVIEALAPKTDALIIGGGMCYTFLAAQGHDVQKSLLQEEMIDTCRDLLERFGDSIVLPVDVVAADRFDKDAEKRTVDVSGIPEGWMGLDMGPKSVELFAARLAEAKTIFWNGPMGVFEFPAFAEGTKGVAEAMISATENGAFSVVGGGDSAASVRTLGLNEDGFSHISTGGGASLEFLEGKTLPGVNVLEN